MPRGVNKSSHQAIAIQVSMLDRAIRDIPVNRANDCFFHRGESESGCLLVNQLVRSEREPDRGVGVLPGVNVPTARGGSGGDRYAELGGDVGAVARLLASLAEDFLHLRQGHAFLHLLVVGLVHLALAGRQQQAHQQNQHESSILQRVEHHRSILHQGRQTLADPSSHARKQPGESGARSALIVTGRERHGKGSHDRKALNLSTALLARDADLRLHPPRGKTTTAASPHETRTSNKRVNSPSPRECFLVDLAITSSGPCSLLQLHSRNGIVSARKQPPMLLLLR